jgi:hypothetical protein
VRQKPRSHVGVQRFRCGRRLVLSAQSSRRERAGLVAVTTPTTLDTPYGAPDEGDLMLIVYYVETVPLAKRDATGRNDQSAHWSANILLRSGADD